MKMMLRRDLRLFLRGLGLCLAVLLLLSALAVGAIFAAAARDAGQDVRADVVLCDRDGGLLSRMAVNLVLQQEFAGRSMSVTRAAEAEGLAMLREGRCHAVIVLPEGYLDALMYGEAGEMKIYLSQAAARESALVEQLAQIGRTLITAGQYGVFAGQHLIWDAGLPDAVHDAYLDTANQRFIDEALSAYDAYFSVEVLPPTAMSAARRSALALLGFGLLLLPAFFTELYHRDRDSDVYPRLRALGVGRSAFYCGKLLYPAVLDLLVCAAALLLARRFSVAVGLPLILAVCGGALALSLLSSGLCLLQKRGSGLPTVALLGIVCTMAVIL